MTEIFTPTNNNKNNNNKISYMKKCSDWLKKVGYILD